MNQVDIFGWNFQYSVDSIGPTGPKRACLLSHVIAPAAQFQ